MNVEVPLLCKQLVLVTPSALTPVSAFPDLPPPSFTPHCYCSKYSLEVQRYMQSPSPLALQVIHDSFFLVFVIHLLFSCVTLTYLSGPLIRQQFQGQLPNQLFGPPLIDDLFSQLQTTSRAQQYTQHYIAHCLAQNLARTTKICNTDEHTSTQQCNDDMALMDPNYITTKLICSNS